ncbi:hypothetical protein SAMN05216298_5138 [Glycomyces sambucus]|uniref:Zn-dependent protease with chaperone function n=1 Tax=Glycomyces sambucus TaxID=380244 RepID=A0A1G9MRG2_9ACTN|nr:hypothetical protein [Glycomyces sambucus]SDL76840.1 hypothetical protein SAMN05216298_5138 [Glycomyces sambucus]
MLCLALQWGFVPWALLSAALFGALVVALASDYPLWIGLAAGALVAVTLLAPLLDAVRAVWAPLRGEPVDREQAPALWALIEETAAAVGGAVPDVLLVDHLSTVYSQHEKRDGRTHYTLLIGLQVVTPRTLGQFRAFLGSHLAGSASSSASIEGQVWSWHLYLQTVFAKYALNPLNLALWPYAALCFAVSSRITAARVLVGDQAAARFAGGANTWSTLAEAQVLDRLGPEFDRTHLLPAIDAGLLPFDIVGGFVQYLDSVHERRAALRAEPLTAARAWNATHPPLARRVAAVVDVPGDLRPGDEAPAIGVFADAAAIAAAVDAMWSVPGTVRGTWEEAAERLELRMHRNRATLAYRAMGRLLGSSRASLDALLGEIETGRRDELFLALDRRGFPAGGLASIVAMAAMRSQEMKYEVRWGEGTGLVGADGRPFEPKELIAPLFAAEPDPDAVRKALADRGVDLHRAVAEG